VIRSEVYSNKQIFSLVYTGCWNTRSSNFSFRRQLYPS